MVKRRWVAAAVNPREFPAHELRSGYLIAGTRQGVPVPEAMQQSPHRSVLRAASYDTDADRTKGKAVRLAIWTAEFRGAQPFARAFELAAANPATAGRAGHRC